MPANKPRRQRRLHSDLVLLANPDPVNFYLHIYLHREIHDFSSKVVGSNPAIPTISKSRSFARGAGIFSLYPSKISKINGLAWVMILVDRCSRM